MRTLNSQADLSDLPPELATVIESCLQRWADSGLLCDPDLDEVVLLVEPGDSNDDLVGYSSSLAALQNGEAPPFEWILDYGGVFEAGMVTGDDGSGFSLILPKADGINKRLLTCCAESALTEPAVP